jgi:hypothetical protein
VPACNHRLSTRWPVGWLTCLIFRQNSLNMSWHIGRMVWQATKGADPDVKRIARHNLAGVLGLSALFSGALGLPMALVMMGVLNAVAASAGDGDDQWDAETEFRAFLSDVLGPDIAALVLGGVVNPLTGADVASRVDLSQLWFRDANRELVGRGAYANLFEQAAGPMGGLLKNALVGKQLMDEGHTMRGIETMLPKALKDGVKAVRYATEGVNNLRGDPLVRMSGLEPRSCRRPASRPPRSPSSMTATGISRTTSRRSSRAAVD